MDPDRYRAESRAAWDAAAPGWAAVAGEFPDRVAPVTARLVEAVARVREGVVLELAAGPGETGLAAATRLGPGVTVLITDQSPRMVEAARSLAAARGLENVACRVLEAERMDLADGSAAAVLCRFGFMLMADPAVAFAETRRVLRAGGRLACAVWASGADNPWATEPGRALRARGLPGPGSGDGPGMFALADPARLHALLAGAGFAEVAVEDVCFSMEHASFEEYWRAQTTLSQTLRRALDELGPAASGEVREEVAAALARHERGGRLDVPARALVATAR